MKWISLRRYFTVPFIAIVAIYSSKIVNAATDSQGTCENALTRAREQYKNSLFREAIVILKNCLDEVPVIEREESHRYLALSYLAIDDTAQARATLIKLLKVQPSYQEDPVNDPPPYVKLVQEIRSTLKPREKVIVHVPTEPSEGNLWTWLVVGAGVVVAAIIVIMITK